MWLVFFFVLLGFFIGLFSSNSMKVLTGRIIECSCERNFDPVCSHGTTYMNPCLAACNDMEITHLGACDVCGDNLCDGNEDKINCPEDCGYLYCEDNKTKYNTCSNNLSLYCDNGKLVEDCVRCGCPFEVSRCIPENRICQTFKYWCDDGTDYIPFEQCAKNKPWYCDLSGKFYQSCQVCGCPRGHECTRDKGACKRMVCDENTKYDFCSSEQPWYCSNGTLVQACNICECKEGSICLLNGECRPLECSDSSVHNECSKDKPLLCSFGELVLNCTRCGCYDGFECLEDGSCKSHKEYATQVFQKEIDVNLDSKQVSSLFQWLDKLFVQIEKLFR